MNLGRLGVLPDTFDGTIVERTCYGPLPGADVNKLTARLLSLAGKDSQGYYVESRGASVKEIC